MAWAFSLTRLMEQRDTAAVRCQPEKIFGWGLQCREAREAKTRARVERADVLHFLAQSTYTVTARP